jgi:hypothetical protein
LLYQLWKKPHLRTVNAYHSIAEGGSLLHSLKPDDDFKYVLKFKGAGHGSFDCRINWWRNSSCFKPKMPELVYANLDEAFGRSEADEEIQDCFKAVRD